MEGELWSTFPAMRDRPAGVATRFFAAGDPRMRLHNTNTRVPGRSNQPERRTFPPLGCRAHRDERERVKHLEAQLKNNWLGWSKHKAAVPVPRLPSRRRRKRKQRVATPAEVIIPAKELAEVKSAEQRAAEVQAAQHAAAQRVEDRRRQLGRRDRAKSPPHPLRVGRAVDWILINKDPALDTLGWTAHEYLRGRLTLPAHELLHRRAAFMEAQRQRRMFKAQQLEAERVARERASEDSERRGSVMMALLEHQPEPVYVPGKIVTRSITFDANVTSGSGAEKDQLIDESRRYLFTLNV